MCHTNGKVASAFIKFEPLSVTMEIAFDCRLNDVIIESIIRANQVIMSSYQVRKG